MMRMDWSSREWERNNAGARALPAWAASFCAITFHGGDKLRLLNVPPQQIGPFAGMLERSWTKGIQRQSLSGYPQFKLRGYPWQGQGGESVSARWLVTNILAFMYNNGWGIVTTTGISTYYQDKDTLFFRRVRPEPNSSFWAISFNASNRMRIIGAPKEIQAAVCSCVRSSWASGIQAERVYHGAKELKLRGHPWTSCGQITNHAHLLLLQLMATLENLGSCLYASVDVVRTPRDYTEYLSATVDTWILKFSTTERRVVTS